MTDLRDRLQASLGESYRLERELGGGGMSRVFVARDTRLGREVVVKVLKPGIGERVRVDLVFLRVSARVLDLLPVLRGLDVSGLIATISGATRSGITIGSALRWDTVRRLPSRAES